MAGSGLVLEVAGVTLGVREGVIGLIAFVALYMLVLLLRMRHLRGKPPAVVAPPVPEPEPQAQDAVSAPIPDVAPPPAEPEIPWNEPPERSSPEALPAALQQEVLQLRDEVDALRGEVAALRDDMLQEFAHMRAAQTVSPIYGDAMQMAVSGYEPAVIAERCGIARAEAELVVALAKSQNQ